MHRQRMTTWDWTIKALRPGTQIDGRLVEASQGHLYIGIQAVTYCPASAGHCLNNNTIYARSILGTVSQSQLIYVQTDGAVVYTEAGGNYTNMLIGGFGGDYYAIDAPPYVVDQEYKGGGLF
ncbi:hypothetical protein K470DRAFT_265549 [Piedraia hortae CBS 480.64]|uniref:Uncharacterized protein n=1 Tax=Piedraia hortae CBS 480.64 TaxID=1314780 RepID=A0A6A7BVD5_9PEZI|nr:hypothetical protein K470DRAFT_265549 [Piedraia hortae CBS 480.64]